MQEHPRGFAAELASAHGGGEEGCGQDQGQETVRRGEGGRGGGEMVVGGGCGGGGGGCCC